MVEGAALEKRCGRKVIVSSNLTHSANFLQGKKLARLARQTLFDEAVRQDIFGTGRILFSPALKSRKTFRLRSG